MSKILMASVASILVLTFAATMAAAQTSTTQYAVYNIATVGRGTLSVSGTINESVTPLGNGMSNYSLQVQSNMINTAFTRTLNSSLVFFPVLPAITNRSFSYSSPIYNYSITAIVNETGNTSVTVSGQSYNVTNFTYNATVSQYKYSSMVSGNASVFSNGLLYSAAFNDSYGQSFHVWLNSTNLPLNSSLSTTNSSSSSSSSTSSATTTSSSAATSLPVFAALASSAFIGVGAFALFQRHRKQISLGRHGSSGPSYQVD
jgi:hypothetical protein